MLRFATLGTASVVALSLGYKSYEKRLARTTAAESFYLQQQSSNNGAPSSPAPSSSSSSSSSSTLDTIWNKSKEYATRLIGSNDDLEFPPAQQLPSRQEILQQMKSGKEFDLLVIGGGATGAGVALDAVSRGLSVALVERDDFSSGTSSRSTKLIHGGVRYLENAFRNLDYEQYQLVAEALHERKNLLKIAPHLSYELPIMLPVYQWWQLPYYWVGAKVYDLIAGRQGLQSSYLLTKRQALEKFPMLKEDSLCGAIVYYDGAHNDSRMNVSLILTAIKYGAAAANHVEVTQLVKQTTPNKQNPQLCGAVVKDILTGESWEIKSKGIINATGPFCDAIRKLDDPTVEPMVAPSAGVHVILPDYYSPHDMGLVDPATKDGRVIFFLPWQNGTIAGTTDAKTEVTHNPVPDEAAIGFILNEIKHYLSPEIRVRRGDVLAAWSGIRPLVRDPGAKNTAALSRNHVVHVSNSGLLTIAGGKWTTYRKMALDTVDKAIEAFNLKPSNPSRTEYLMLCGAENWSTSTFIRLIQKHGIETEVADHLSKSYGTLADSVLQYDDLTGKRFPVKGRRIVDCYPYIEGEIKYGMEKEYACTIVDVLARRTRIAFLNANAAMDALPKIADIMAQSAGWTEERKQKEIAEAKQFLLTMGLEGVTTGYQFNRMELIRYRDEFAAFDLNEDGHISPDEFRQALQNMGIKMTDSNFNKIVNQIDKDRNGTIEFNEFLEFIAQSKREGILTEKITTSDDKQVEFVRAVQKVTNKFGTDRSGGGL